MDEESNPTLLDYLNFGSKTATGVLGALNQPKTTVVQPGKNNWAMIVGIGAAILGVILLILVATKK